MRENAKNLIREGRYSSVIFCTSYSQNELKRNLERSESGIKILVWDERKENQIR